MSLQFDRWTLLLARTRVRSKPIAEEKKLSHPALQAQQAALITGGASGIGLAVAEKLTALGLNVCLADRDEEALQLAGETLDGKGPGNCITRVTNVSDADDMAALKSFVDDNLGALAFLMNNAGIGGGGGAFANLEGWQRVLGVNLWGVVHGLQTFVPDMIAAGNPGIVVNTGSKQGITNPPGDAAYNVSKAGVRAVTEHLAHEFRNTDGCKLSAHLLVPGFTYTGMIRRFVETKPAAAWTPEQVAERLMQSLEAGDFYIICPDNDVSEAMDAGRIQWNTDDLLKNRPALSRWHPEYADAFAEHMKNFD